MKGKSYLKSFKSNPTDPGLSCPLTLTLYREELCKWTPSHSLWGGGEVWCCDALCKKGPDWLSSICVVQAGWAGLVGGEISSTVLTSRLPEYGHSPLTLSPVWSYTRSRRQIDRSPTRHLLIVIVQAHKSYREYTLFVGHLDVNPGHEHAPVSYCSHVNRFTSLHLQHSK